MNAVKIKTESLEQKSVYDVRILNIFIESVSEIFKHYLDTDPKLGKPTVKTTTKSFGRITGMIVVDGPGIKGSVAASFNEGMLIAVGQSMTASFEAKDLAFTDLAGEICNQITGNVRSKMASVGLKMSIGLPKIFLGEGKDIVHEVQNTVIAMSLTNAGRKAMIEFCLLPQKQMTVVSDEVVHLEPGSAILL
jgi:CheY-specific phosphatase CheX